MFIYLHHKIYNEMKKTVSAAIGSKNFIIDEDAYSRLDTYLKAFRSRLGSTAGADDIMRDLEDRISELLACHVRPDGGVVTLDMIEIIASQIGMPDSTSAGSSSSGQSYSYTGSQASGKKARRKFYRDPDKRSIAGVCSGLAEYTDTDLTIIRIIAVILLLCFSCGFWIYLVFWLVAPLAKTPTEKCELRGLEPTYENLSQFSNN